MAFMMGRNDTQNTSPTSPTVCRCPECELDGKRRAQSRGSASGTTPFWTPARVESISADQGWAVPHAHNTYLDQALSLGVFGALFYAVMVWSTVFMAWRRSIAVTIVLELCSPQCCSRGLLSKASPNLSRSIPTCPLCWLTHASRRCL